MITQAHYRVALWDCDTQHFEDYRDGLSARETVKIVHELEGEGWDRHISIYVDRRSESLFMPKPVLISTKQAAGMLKCSRQTVRNLGRSGRIKLHRKPGLKRRYLFDRAEVEALGADAWKWKMPRRCG